MSAGAVTNMAGLIACRAMLGIFEASFGAGAYVYHNTYNIVCIGIGLTTFIVRTISRFSTNAANSPFELHFCWECLH